MQPRGIRPRQPCQRDYRLGSRPLHQRARPQPVHARIRHHRGPALLPAVPTARPPSPPHTPLALSRPRAAHGARPSQLRGSPRRLPARAAHGARACGAPSMQSGLSLRPACRHRPPHAIHAMLPRGRLALPHPRRPPGSDGPACTSRPARRQPSHSIGDGATVFLARRESGDKPRRCSGRAGPESATACSLRSGATRPFQTPSRTGRSARRPRRTSGEGKCGWN